MSDSASDAAPASAAGAEVAAVGGEVAAVGGEVAAAAPRVHAKAINPSWQFEDFFLLSASEQQAVKKALAGYLDIRITDVVNAKKPMAHEVAGVKPYDPEAVKQAYTTYQAYKKDAGSISEAERAQKMDAAKSATLTISGSAWQLRNLP